MHPSDFVSDVEAILFAALELSGQQRAAFLDVRCGQRADLRAEVESLLEAHEHAAGFTQSGAIGAATAAAGALRSRAGVGDRVGPFRLVDVVGEGGMGTVFRAERADGEFAQQVAIKFIGSWTRDPAAEQRFRAERQILASLQHPHIVSLIDGGVTPYGDAYLVMEYVDGQPITTYCRRHSLPLDRRLRLFSSVCAAVHFAHAHLIVHRDLKPANVVVTADGVAKILDFGVAKLLDPAPAGSVTLTAVLPGPLTPNYASPEQLRGLPITTVSDVYALGVLLYELLTGSRPYETTGKPLDEMLSLVVASERVPPSAARSRPDDALPFPRSAVAGDLDAIALKALNQDPAHRYSSAADLAEDIERFLRGQVVLARPDSALYRVRKFIRRHRAAAVGASAAIFSLVIGLAMAVWQANVARAERDRARLETEKAQQVSAFLRALFTSNAPLEALGRKITAEELLKNGVQRIDRELSGQPEVQASMLASLGSVYAEMNRHQNDALPLVERSLALRERLFGSEHAEVAESLFILGRLKSRGFADYQAAEQLLKRAIGIRERLVGPADPALPSVLSELGMALWRAGKYQEGQTALRRAVAIGEQTEGPELHKWIANLALLDQWLGDFDSAELLLRRAFALGVKAEGRPGVPVGPTMLNLGSLLRAQEKFAEARQVLEDLNADEERTWGISRMYTLGELGDLYFAMGEHRRAREVLERAIAIGEVERDIPEPPDLARSLTYSGRLYLAEGKPREARMTLQRALRIRERFLGATHQDVAETLVELARAQAALESNEVAEPLLRRALAIQRQALVSGHRLLVPTLVTLGEMMEARGQTGESRALVREAVDIARRRLPQHHSERRRAEDALRQMSD